MTYDEALALVNGLESRPWRKGLDRMCALVERAGLTPTLANKNYVHVAGTNGKGTTTAFIESILRHQGHRTGAFFSPYVVDYRERIQAEGRLIEHTELVALVERLLPVANSLSDTEFGGASKFELEAAMGLAYWEQKECDWVALEVGLGGRLDATNVVSPSACVIVSIGLDHTAILGDTLEQIAAEKAGIVKRGVPVVLGSMAPEAEATILQIAQTIGAPVWRVGSEIGFRGTHRGFEVITPMGRFESENPSFGGFPPTNATLAIAACAAAGALRDGSDLTTGVKNAWLPGRGDWREVMGRKVLFDGAHNADAARPLAQGFKGVGPIRLVSNMLVGHEVAPFYEAFKEIAVAVEVAPIQSPRALSTTDAVRVIESLGIPARSHPSVYKAVQTALEEEETVVVTGSNYLVGAALRLFGGTIDPD